MKETVLVVGGGIAGMETAVQLKSLGLVPVIVEKSSSLGGHVAQWNRLFPDMTPANKVLEPYDEALKEVDIYTDTEIASMNYLQKEYVVVLSNGKNLRCKAVVFATGFKLFEAEKKEEYGYGIYDRVITNRDLENWFNTRSDERVPVKPAAIGFVHCVGSRDVKAGNSQCSKVCCITAIKQAIEMKEIFPDAEIYCFYMDLRLFGKKYEDFYINAQRDYGIHFIRGRVSEVAETIDGRVQVKAEDTLPAVYDLGDAICPKSLNIWLGASDEFHRKLAGRPDKELWLYSCSGPARTFDPVFYHRAQAWRAWGLGAKASLFCGFR